MFRLVGASRVLREAFPAELVPFAWAVTLLGSATFLVFALSLTYWNWSERRDEVLALVSVAFVALTVTLVLKHGFDLPRPPATVRRYPVETSDVGFPSGHAIAATVVYGGGLVALDRWRDSRAVGAVAALVVAIGLSRVVLGVHYLGDVLAGWAVGLTLLGAVRAVVERGAADGFAAAALLSVPALAVTGVSGDALLAFGGSLGGFLGVRWRTPAPAVRTVGERLAVNAAGLGVVAAALVTERAVEGVSTAVAGVNFLLAFGIVAVPTMVARIEPLGPPDERDR